jgi:hypothetical protein
MVAIYQPFKESELLLPAATWHKKLLVGGYITGVTPFSFSFK